ncbi:hypothetical protein ACLKA7_010554 [Drosophila subpalustris]
MRPSSRPAFMQLSMISSWLTGIPDADGDEDQDEDDEEAIAVVAVVACGPRSQNSIGFSFVLLSLIMFLAVSLLPKV